MYSPSIRPIPFLVCLCTCICARTILMHTQSKWNAVRYWSGLIFLCNFFSICCLVSLIAFAAHYSFAYALKKPTGKPAKLIVCMVCSNGRNLSATIRNYNLNCKHVDVYFIIDSIATRQWTMNLGELECTAAVATMAVAAAAVTKKQKTKC